MSNTKIFIKDQVRIYITDATDIAQEAIKAHQTKPLASLTLSTAIATFSLFASLNKVGKTVIKINGNGPLKTILVETNEDGHVRALIGNPNVVTEFDKERFNDIPLTLGIGDSGSLTVTREVDGVNFGGEVALANADIVTDLAWYFDQSEQINTAIISDVKLATPQKIERAYSVFFQMLPEHTEIDVRWVEEFIKQTKLSRMSLKEYITKMDAKEIGKKDIEWKCTCSQSKMEELVKMVPLAEQKEIIKEHGKLEITCNYCRNKYVLK